MTVQWDFSLSVPVFYMHIVFLADAWDLGKIQAELPFSLLSLDREFPWEAGGRHAEKLRLQSNTPSSSFLQAFFRGVAWG